MKRCFYEDLQQLHPKQCIRQTTSAGDFNIGTNTLFYSKYEHTKTIGPILVHFDERPSHPLRPSSQNKFQYIHRPKKEKISNTWDRQPNKARLTWS